MCIAFGERLVLRRAIVVTLLTAATLAIGTVAGQAQTSEKKTFKIGILGDYQGVIAVAGKETADGVKLLLNNAQYKNWRVELVEEDAAGSPTVALSKFKKLVEQDKVNMVIGPTSSVEAAAVKSYINDHSVPTLFTNAFAKTLTGPTEYSPWVLRTLETSDQDNYPLGTWVAKNTPFKRIFILASDFSTARQSAEGFSAGFKAAGGTIVGEAFPATGAPDFGPTLSALDPKQIDAVYVWFQVGDAARFLETYSAYGLKARLPLIGGVANIVDESFIDKLGPAALDVITSSNYSPELDTPANASFKSAYAAAYNNRPVSVYAVNAYTGAQLIDAALKSLDASGVSTVSSAELLATFKKVAPTVDSPTGKIAFDQYGQVVTTIYIRKVQQKGSGLVNGVVGKVENVAQSDVWGYWVKP